VTPTDEKVPCRDYKDVLALFDLNTAPAYRALRQKRAELRQENAAREPS
jgi:hypothetical protein